MRRTINRWCMIATILVAAAVTGMMAVEPPTTAERALLPLAHDLSPPTAEMVGFWQDYIETKHTDLKFEPIAVDYTTTATDPVPGANANDSNNNGVSARPTGLGYGHHPLLNDMMNAQAREDDRRFVRTIGETAGAEPALHNFRRGLLGHRLSKAMKHPG